MASRAEALAAYRAASADEREAQFAKLLEMYVDVKCSAEALLVVQQASRTTAAHVTQATALMLKVLRKHELDMHNPLVRQCGS